MIWASMKTGINAAMFIQLSLLLFCLLLADWCTIETVKTAFPDFFASNGRRFIIAYIAIHLIFALVLFIAIYSQVPRIVRTISFVGVFILYFSKISIIVFFLIDQLRRLGIFTFRSIKNTALPEDTLPAADAGQTISRSEFLAKTGLAVAAIPLISLNAGMIKGVYDYRVKTVKLVLPALPVSFEGMRIAQISDIHSGSFYNKKAVSKGIDLLMSQKADIIFFTGDLVNDRTSEMKDYQDLFSRVKAPLGVFSTLGNHDYGDYVWWPSAQAKQKNLEDLITVHRLMGYQLLMNENRKIKIGSDEIAILGVENWGRMSRFPKYGRVDLAVKGVEEIPVKLLLSHDPSHWRAQVLPKFPQISAMFSGHTHGMQMGIRTPHFQWSPIQYVYPEWAGHYQEANQQLYVNVGYGFLGYPGRIGVYPEITVFELSRNG